MSQRPSPRAETGCTRHSSWLSCGSLPRASAPNASRSSPTRSQTACPNVINRIATRAASSGSAPAGTRCSTATPSRRMAPTRAAQLERLRHPRNRGRRHWVATSGGLRSTRKENRRARGSRAADGDPPRPPMLHRSHPTTVTSPRVRFSRSPAVARRDLVRHLQGPLPPHECRWTMASSLRSNIGSPGRIRRARETRCCDRAGTLWIATGYGLYRRWPDGTTSRYGKHDGLPDDNIHDLLQDRRAASGSARDPAGLCVLAADPITRPLP